MSIASINLPRKGKDSETSFVERDMKLLSSMNSGPANNALIAKKMKGSATRFRNHRGQTTIFKGFYCGNRVKEYGIVI
jgi:hypothetical protein